MSISITGKHIDVGEALSTHIENVVENITHKYFGDPIEANIVVTKGAHRFVIDFSVHVTKNFVVRTHGEDEDPYRASDQAAERMENRIRRYKSRLRNKKRHPHIDESMLMAQQYVVNAEVEDQGDDTPIIIAEMTNHIPILTVGEAVMRMDLSDQSVMMFKNSKHGGLNVVYKRNDGHIGWIDPALVS